MDHPTSPTMDVPALVAVDVAVHVHASVHAPGGPQVRLREMSEYCPPSLVQHANTLLEEKVLSGSDSPVIAPDRWLAELDRAGIRESVRPLIVEDDAVRLLGLGS